MSELDQILNMMDPKWRYRPKPNEHELFRSPLHGVSESFAQGIYESPGELTRLIEAMGEMSTGQRSTRPASRLVDALTQVNELGYTPENYGASPMVQALSRFGGNFIGDPANIIPGGYIANKFGREVASEVVDQSLKTGLRNQSGMVGYHGSPYKFDRFDHAQMGSGEGAQAYGWGTYIAENPDVAKNYRGMLPPSGNNVTASKKFDSRISLLAKEWADDDVFKLVDILEKDKTKYPELFHDADEMITRIQTEWVGGKRPSYMYSVDLPDEKIAQMLDWDAPLSEQPDSVRAALGKLNIKSPLVENMSREDLIDQLKFVDKNGVWDDADNIAEYGAPATIEELRESAERMDLQYYLDSNILSEGSEGNGRSLYYHLTSKLGGGNPGSNVAQELASKELRKLGIPGIKYFDGGSRSAGKGTRNFVVFDENDMSILSRNGEKIAQPLPMDEASRMQRARDMGFDLDVFRGSNFDSEELKGTVFLSSEPSVASDFAMFLRTYEGANVSPSKIKGKFLEIDADFSDIREAEKMAGKQFAGITDADYPNGLEIYDWAKANSYDGVKFKNAIDDPLGPNIPKASDVYAVFDPKNIRSKFAKFDPAKKESAKLLAGGLLGAVGINALNNQLERKNRF